MGNTAFGSLQLSSANVVAEFRVHYGVYVSALNGEFFPYSIEWQQGI